MDKPFLQHMIDARSVKLRPDEKNLIRQRLMSIPGKAAVFEAPKKAIKKSKSPA